MEPMPNVSYVHNVGIYYSDGTIIDEDGEIYAVYGYSTSTKTSGTLTTTSTTGVSGRLKATDDGEFTCRFSGFSESNHGFWINGVAKEGTYTIKKCDMITYIIQPTYNGSYSSTVSLYYWNGDTPTSKDKKRVISHT